jgi:hypothetical protein
MANSNKENEIKEQAETDEVLQKTYHFVALSSAIAIQDAVDNLRSINTICTTAIGAAMARAIEEPSCIEDIQKVIVVVQSIAKDAANNFELINRTSTALVNNFPKGQ